jgi:hypothetical protein
VSIVHGIAVGLLVALLVFIGFILGARAEPNTSVHYPTYRHLPSIGIDNEQQQLLATLARPPAGFVPERERIVIDFGRGGSISEHNLRFAGYRYAGFEVEIRGPCISACTLITAHIGKDKLCIGPNAFFAFNAARSANGDNKPLATGAMYRQQPPEIRAWIDRKGGWENIPLDDYWNLYPHELWAMGYPKCK